MKIRATRNFLNDVGMVRRGAEVDIKAVQAKSLIARGLAIAIEGPASKPKSKPKARTGSDGAAASREGE